MALISLDRFKIKNEVAKRLCYTLYEAVDESDGQAVSIKIFDETRASDKHSIFNFLNGARIASLLDNPDIARIYHFGSDFGRYFIASEAISYTSLRSLIKPTFALSFDDLVEIFVRIGKAMRYAHLQGAIHGLLNPDSIFINADGAIKIDDFGFNWYIPQLLKRPDKEATQFAHHISPQCYDHDKLDGSVDIYSLGTILYHLVNGAPPFKGHTVSALYKQHVAGEIPAINWAEKGLPPEMEAILQKSITVKVEKRFLNFKDFLDSMELLRRGYLKLAEAPATSQEAEQIVHEKYFDDKPYEIDYQSKARRLFSINPKVATVSGAAIFLVLIFFLIITNKLPLPFYEDDDESGIIAEQLLAPPVSGTQPDALLSGMSPDSLEAPSDSSAVAVNDSIASASVGSLLASESTTVPDINSNHTPPSKAVDSNVTVEKTLTANVSANKPRIETPTKATGASTKKPAANNTSTPKVVVAAVDRPTAKPTAAKVTVMVQSQNQPVEAFVFVDNEFKGKTNLQGFFEIPDLAVNKNYSVKISKEGHATFTRQFTALGKTPVLNFDISPRQEINGTLILEVLPKADSILVDGKLYQGKSPMQLNLPRGEHRVLFVNTSLNKRHEQVVSLKVGEVQRIKHNFAAAELGKVAVSLKNAAQFGFGYVYIDGKPWDGTPNTTPLELSLAAGSHTVEIRRDGFNAVPRDIIVVVEKDQTKYVSFTLMKN